MNGGAPFFEMSETMTNGEPRRQLLSASSWAFWLMVSTI